MLRPTWAVLHIVPANPRCLSLPLPASSERGRYKGQHCTNCDCTPMQASEVPAATKNLFPKVPDGAHSTHPAFQMPGPGFPRIPVFPLDEPLFASLFLPSCPLASLCADLPFALSTYPPIHLSSPVSICRGLSFLQFQRGKTEFYFCSPHSRPVLFATQTHDARESLQANPSRNILSLSLSRHHYRPFLFSQFRIIHCPYVALLWKPRKTAAEQQNKEKEQQQGNKGKQAKRRKRKRTRYTLSIIESPQPKSRAYRPRPPKAHAALNTPAKNTP